MRNSHELTSYHKIFIYCVLQECTNFLPMELDWELLLMILSLP